MKQKLKKSIKYGTVKSGLDVVKEQLSILDVYQKKATSPHKNIFVFIGDVRKVLKKLPDECVDCVITSPPYWQQRDYK
ncbi:MAG: hypothetical protein ABIL70_06115, partial [candidate division WOR-3 bacterium]